MVDPHSDPFTFKITPSLQSCSNYFSKTASCALGTGCVFESVCSSLPTYFVLQVHNVLSKRNSYFVNRVSSAVNSSSDRCLFL